MKCVFFCIISLWHICIVHTNTDRYRRHKPTILGTFHSIHETNVLFHILLSCFFLFRIFLFISEFIFYVCIWYIYVLVVGLLHFHPHTCVQCSLCGSDFFFYTLYTLLNSKQFNVSTAIPYPLLLQMRIHRFIAFITVLLSLSLSHLLNSLQIFIGIVFMLISS